ncbi:7TM diverse intracellular signaling domain-containing protein [Hymenobacter sp. BT770]|uniref:7TM diverse intracellular signaling domain-containing protein n=1 Tax=Hymenobacter sp. BT770 TaxID=2886942 RepID=UPI001D11AD5B|nr:7TM diverse intracellular signaling domain-containing protein [Hymenobacter sp. BT770]MCC3154904.1 histidine kinase [Hymenobacter sp. BT770]MDO3417346.1 7TM diverse intracellular signaling domain-containing protein [Hymenobacter sp. BT770]
MRFRFFIALMLGGWLLGTWAVQAADPPHTLRDTLLLKDPKGVHISEAYRYYTEPFGVPASPEQAEAQWRAGKFRPGPWHKTLNLGIMHRRVWMRLPVRNTEPQRLRFLWSIFNFTDSAALYCRRQGETTFTRLGAASSWVPATERLFPARSLSFPFTLNPGEAAVLYLRADVHTGGVYLPTYIETAEHFLSWEMHFPFERHWVWLLGFYLSSALFNLVLFAFLRDRIHLWYGAYVVCVTLFLMMEDGLDAMLLPAGLYRLIWSVGQYNFIVLAGAAGIRIMQLFLRLRSGWRGLYLAGNWLAGTAVTFVAVYAVLFPWAVKHNLGLVEVLNGARELLVLLVFGYGWVTLLTVFMGRRRRRLAAYYALTYFFFFTGYAVFWLNHLGLTSYNPVYPNTLAWGLFLELLVLSALLTGRFRHTLRQNARLRIQELQQRNEVGRRLIAAQDAEREQLARELHDAMGPNLAALHMAWQSEAVREALAAAPKARSIGQLTEEILGQLYEQVRQLSHALLPAEPGTNRLTRSVASLCEALNLNGTPRVITHFDADIDQLPQAVQSAAYRIVAELVNNAVRHAQAHQVEVQLRLHPEVLELCVEDDGRGFGRGEDAPITGIGLRGVRTRTAYLGGTVNIESPGYGTRVVVRLPY